MLPSADWLIVHTLIVAAVAGVVWLILRAVAQVTPHGGVFTLWAVIMLTLIILKVFGVAV